MAPLNPCRCGGTPTLDATGVQESSGRAWQSWWVSCDRCRRNVSIEFDADALNEGTAAEAAVIMAWNAIQPTA